MDTSNSTVDYVVNGYKAPLNQLSSREWLAVIKIALDRAGSILSYLPHIRDPRQALREVVDWGLYDVDHCPAFPRLAWRSGYKHWFVEENVRLIPLGFTTVPQTEPKENSFGEWETQWPDVHLFISTRRQWIKLERVFVEKRSRNSSYEQFLFCGLNEEELLGLIGDNLICWPRMLIYLQQLASKGIHQKRQHIEALEHVAGRLAEMKSRVGPIA